MRAVSIAALVVVLAGCGVSTSDDLSTAAPEDVPYDLLAPRPSTSTTTTEAEQRITYAAVWFVSGDGILPLFRTVPSPPDVDDVLAALAAGPTDGEARLGARSAVPIDADGIAARTAGTMVVVQLPAGFGEAAPREQLLGLAQLVYTLTELGAVDRVKFEIDGVEVAAPRADGSVTDEPLRRADYEALKG